jgi:ribosomal protein L19E
VTGAVLALGLIGCGERGVWIRESATETEVRAAQKACVRESLQYDWLNNESANMSPASRYTVMNRGEVYRLCMMRRGFSQVPESTLKQ